MVTCHNRSFWRKLRRPNDSHENRGIVRITVGIPDDVREPVSERLPWFQGRNLVWIGRVNNEPGIGVDGEAPILQRISPLAFQVRAAVRARLATGPDDIDRCDRQRIRFTIGIAVVDQDLATEGTIIELINRPAVEVVLGDRRIVLSGDLDTDLCCVRRPEHSPCSESVAHRVREANRGRLVLLKTAEVAVGG